MGHVNDIFLTGRNVWGGTGGLLGLVLTVAESTGAAAVSVADSHRAKLEGVRARLVECEAKSDSKKKEKEAEGLRGQLARLEEKMKTDERGVERRATLTVHGPPNLAHMVAAARRFIFSKGDAGLCEGG